MVDPSPKPLLETLNQTIRFFQKKNIPQAQLSAQWLFAEALGCKRLDLYLRYNEILPESILSVLRDWVARRAKREPWPYIVGHTPFLDLDLKTDARALIPRPETEELVVTLIEEAQLAPKRILDLGTGTGAIALSLARAYPDALVVAVDQSLAALSLAQENAIRLQLDQQVTFVHSNWFEHVEGYFDWIIANPPYLTQSEWEQADSEVKDFEPQAALTSPDDGLADLKLILT